MSGIEMWQRDKSNVYLYCEDYSIVKKLSQEFRVGTFYFRGNHVVGWQFLLPMRLVPIIARKMHLDIVEVK